MPYFPIDKIRAIYLASNLANGVEVMTSLMESPNVQNEGLRQAFDLFNEMSQQLTASYSKLENQVQLLSGELAEVTAARMKELKEKERLADRLDRLLHLLPGGVVVLDGAGRIQDVNKAAQSMFSGSRDLKGRLWRDLITQYFCPREDDGHEISMVSGRRVSIQTSALENEPGQIVLITDQTETRDLQDKLARHQRLTAMGKMVASLAHQVRTPLSGAMLYAEHLGKDSLDSSTRERFSEKLAKQLKNIEAQVRDMLIFARGSAPLNSVLSIADLADRIEDIKAQMSQQHAAKIGVQVSHSTTQIQCHSESLIGAIQNLISNGIESAEQAHRIAEIDIQLNVQKGLVCISIFDNGLGIDPTVAQKMGEPFYTTKSNGTGLGLPVVNAVVRAHHGKLIIKNRTSQEGACLEIVIPTREQLTKETKHEQL